MERVAHAGFSCSNSEKAGEDLLDSRHCESGSRIGAAAQKGESLFVEAIGQLPNNLGAGHGAALVIFHGKAQQMRERRGLLGVCELFEITQVKRGLVERESGAALQFDLGVLVLSAASERRFARFR